MERRGGRRPPPAQTPLNWRLYRFCLGPVAVALLICAFSLSTPPAPLSSTLAPEAFEGARAFAQLREMAAIAPDRRPGGRGDARLLRYLEDQLRALGAPASGGYTVGVSDVPGETVWGSRPEPLLIARRAGSSAQAPIVLIARRDSAVRGDRASLSGAAALLELAGVLSQTETRHPVYVIFSDGGSGGDPAAAQWLQSRLGGRLDAAIVLGDLASATPRPPLTQPFSTGVGAAPEVLTRTVSGALRGELGIDPGAPSLLSQLAHLAFPLAVGEQGPLDAAGIPAVTVSLAGERSPAVLERVSEARLQAAGRAVLSAFYALDRGGEVRAGESAGLLLAGRVLPEWAVALLTLTLLIGPLAIACDGLVRLARRGEPVLRWMLLPLSCAAPFLLCAASLGALAAVGLLAAPPSPLGASALGFEVGSALALGAGVVVLAAGWRMWLELLLWTRPPRPPRPARLPRSGVAGIDALASGCLLTLLVWLLDPYAALLALPALHLWPLAACPERRPPGRGARLALVLVPALAPLALLIAFYALSLSLDPAQALLEAILMVAGGYVSFGGVLLWSLASGVIVAVAIATASGETPPKAREARPIEGRTPVLPARRRPVYRERALSGGAMRAPR
jgi:hypothetical protein